MLHRTDGVGVVPCDSAPQCHTSLLLPSAKRFGIPLMVDKRAADMAAATFEGEWTEDPDEVRFCLALRCRLTISVRAVSWRHAHSWWLYGCGCVGGCDWRTHCCLCSHWLCNDPCDQAAGVTVRKEVIHLRGPGYLPVRRM